MVTGQFADKQNHGRSIRGRSTGGQLDDSGTAHFADFFRMII